MGARRFEVKSLVAVAAMCVALSACAMGEEFTRGQKITQDQLEQVPVGSSKEIPMGNYSYVDAYAGNVSPHTQASARFPGRP